MDSIIFFWLLGLFILRRGQKFLLISLNANISDSYKDILEGLSQIIFIDKFNILNWTWMPKKYIKVSSMYFKVPTN